MKIKTTNTICPSCKQLKKVADGKHLKELREAKGLSLRELGKRVNLTPAYLCDIEHNRRSAPRVLITFWTGPAGNE